MSLVMLILLLIIILYRMNHHVREQRELQSQIRTISELLGNIDMIVLFKYVEFIWLPWNMRPQIIRQSIKAMKMMRTMNCRQPTNIHRTMRKRVALNAKFLHGIRSESSRAGNKVAHIHVQGFFSQFSKFI